MPASIWPQKCTSNKRFDLPKSSKASPNFCGKERSKGFIQKFGHASKLFFKNPARVQFTQKFGIS